MNKVKILLFLLVIFFITINLNGQHYDTVALRGNVSTIQKTSFSKLYVTFGREIKDSVFAVYNETGKVSKQEFFKDNEWHTTKQYQYDTLGNEIEYTITEKDKPSRTGWIDIAYDEDNNITKMVESSSNSYKTTTNTYTYNRYQDPTKRTLNTSISGQPISQEFIYVYDIDQNLLSEEHFQDGARFDLFTYEYNEQSDLIASHDHRADGSIYNTTTLEYDDNYRLAQKTTTWPGGIKIISYQYDQKDRLIHQQEKHIYDKEEYPMEEHHYFYNEQGLLSSESSELGGKKQTISYTYDAHQNWIKIIEKENNDEIKIMSRLIEYR